MFQRFKGYFGVQYVGLPYGLPKLSYQIQEHIIIGFEISLKIFNYAVLAARGVV